MESNGIHKRNYFSSELSKADSSNLQLNNSSFPLDSLMEEGLTKKKRVRFIKKSGHCNVSHKHLKDKSRRFLADIFTTGVDLQWRYNLLVFSTAFVLSWIVFGLLYWAESYRHGDFDEHISNTSDFRACIDKLDTAYPFTSVFLFSLETQTTIGYGYRHVTEKCWITITIVVIQSVFGSILDAFMIGLIMAKISRPKKRAETLLFSREAVIGLRDGRLCFMVRVGNLRKSHLVEATIRMQFVHSRETLEGEYIPVEQIDLKLDLKNDSDRLFLVTPQTISHPIDKESPLWDLRPGDMENADFEIIVILEGMVEATGMTTQARASYIPSEIKWGHRFQNMITLSSSNAYKVDFKKFHNIYAVNNPVQRSAKELHDAEQARTSAKVSLRTKRMIQKSNSESSSSRSSTVSNHAYCVEERDSGYTALETAALSGSKSSLNKALTSTTSLSDDSDRAIDEDEEKERKKRDSARSTSSSLIDLSSEKINQTGLADEEKSWESNTPADLPGSCETHETVNRQTSEENGKLLIELEPEVSTSHIAPSSNSFPEHNADKNTFTKVLDNNKALGV